MDEDCQPAQHPQPGAWLSVTGIDPGKQRNQNADYTEYNQFFKSRRHNASFKISNDSDWSLRPQRP